MTNENKIYGIQRYVKDILGYSDIQVPGCIDLPAYIFKHIFDKYHSEIWFHLGQLQGAKHKTDASGSYYIEISPGNHTYCLNYIMGDTVSTTYFDEETSDMLHNYHTSIKRVENLNDLLDEG